ncbi:hypothetical protein RJ640_014872 [Escallonia rubra]|uniref:Ribosomal protein S11 n=1 Tax=Escallonia rubra TaxID=112253 RepID=A0AA88URV2_9ASTE|nr:hypothetical protein RJ640_014872 [Escallonia rubra]
MLRNFSVRTRNRFSVPTFKSNPNFKSPSLPLYTVRFFTSKNDPSIESSNYPVPEPNLDQTQNKDAPEDTEDASYKVLVLGFMVRLTKDGEFFGAWWWSGADRHGFGDGGVVELAMKLGSTKVKENISPPCAMSFSSSIHSVAPLNSQSRWNNDRPMNSKFQWNTSRPINSELESTRLINSELELNKDRHINSESGWNNNRSMNNLSGWSNRPMNFDSGNSTNRSMNFVRGILEENGRDMIGVPQRPRYTLEQNADIVHIKMLRNNCFVTLTDSNGNRKVGASSGSLKDKAEDKSKVAKVSGYAAEATAEHIGRLAKEMKLKSVVMKVNGFTFFKKKKQAILSFREGYTNGRGDANPIVYIEDTTRLPHNGCRLPKKRRI